MRTSNFWRAGVAAVLISVSAGGYTQDKLGYDPAADAFGQLRDAQISAAADGKLILIIAGGEWCIWCHYLDAFLVENPDIGKTLKDTFVVVKAYFGGDNDNEAFFATMPEALGYPHFWVLAADGTMLVSQNTVALEDGAKSYDKRNFIAFIDKWKATL